MNRTLILLNHKICCVISWSQIMFRPEVIPASNAGKLTLFGLTSHFSMFWINKVSFPPSHHSQWSTCIFYNQNTARFSPDQLICVHSSNKGPFTFDVESERAPQDEIWKCNIDVETQQNRAQPTHTALHMWEIEHNAKHQGMQSQMMWAKEMSISEIRAFQ